MKKKIRLKLVVLFSMGLTLILVLFSIIFSINSISHIEEFCKYTDNVEQKNIRKNISMFFLDLTRRISFEHSVFFENIADLTIMLGKQIEYELLNSNDSSNTSFLQMKRFKDTDFFINNKQDREMSIFYWGNGKKPSSLILGQMDNIYKLLPLYKGIFNCKGYFLANISIYNKLNYACIYPANKIHMQADKIKTLRKDLEMLSKRWLVKDNLVMTLPYKDIITGKNIISMLYPVNGKSEGNIAYLCMDIYLDKIIKSISMFNIKNFIESKNMGEALDHTKGFVFIIDKGAELIYSPDKDNYFSQFSDLDSGSGYIRGKKKDLAKSKNPEVRKLSDLMLNNKFGTEIINLKSKSYIVAYSHILSTDWILGYAMSNDLLMKPAVDSRIEMLTIIRKLKIYFIWIAVAFLLVSIFLAIMLFRTFYLNPITNIKREIKKVENGDFNINLCDKGTVEIRELAITFNYMGKKIRNYMDNLKKEVRARQAVETEIKIAADVQKMMVPKITSEFVRNDLDLYVKLVPAKNISGNFYDFYYLNDGRLALLIGDASGQGLSSAFFMAMSKVIIKNYSLAENNGPADVLRNANITLCEDNDAEMYSTAFLIFYNLRTGNYIYASAGHDNVVTFSENENYDYISIKKNLALGSFSDTNYDEGKGKISNNESLFLYTNGLVNSVLPTGDKYGEKRLRNIVMNNNRLSSENLSNVIINDVTNVSNQNRLDDITFLLLKKYK